MGVLGFYWQAEDDRLYADQEQEVLDAYLAGETGDGTGARGDLLSGNEGDDQLYGGADNDWTWRMAA